MSHVPAHGDFALPAPFVALPPTFVVTTPDDAWADDVVCSSSAYQSVTELHFPRFPLSTQVMSPSWQHEVALKAPFRAVTELHAFGAATLVKALSLPMPNDAIARVHIAHSAAGDGDLRVACERYSTLRHVSVCRKIVSTERLRKGLMEAMQLDREHRGRKRRLGASQEQQAISQGHRIDIARIVYCAAKTIEAWAPPTLESAQILFESHDIPEFWLCLQQALSLPLEWDEGDGPTLYDTLCGMQPSASRAQPFVWQFAWQMRTGGPFTTVAVAKGAWMHEAPLQFAPSVFPSNPFDTSLLSTRSFVPVLAREANSP